MPKTLRAYWKLRDSIVEATAARTLPLTDVLGLWKEFAKAEGDYLGLVNEQGDTVQFYLDYPALEMEPDKPETVLVDFPNSDCTGTYQAKISWKTSEAWIARSFEVGPSRANFNGLTFVAWE